MTTVVYTAPAEEPVTASEVKLHAKIDTSADDALITILIAAARQQAELELGRKIITQTLDTYFDAFPEEIRLMPIQSVTSITYADGNGDTQTLSASAYQVDAVGHHARITPAYGYTWPSTRSDQLNAVKVRYVAGYGLQAAVPACIKNWLLIRVAQAYEQRQAVSDFGQAVAFPRDFVDGLLDPERMHGRA